MSSFSSSNLRAHRNRLDIPAGDSYQLDLNRQNPCFDDFDLIHFNNEQRAHNSAITAPNDRTKSAHLITMATHVVTGEYRTVVQEFI